MHTLTSVSGNFIERRSCPVCGDTKTLRQLCSISYDDKKFLDVLNDRYHGNILSRDVEGISYELLYCSACDFMFQACVPGDALSQKIYTYSESRIAESLAKRTHAPLSYYRKNALLVEKMSLLLGGGTPGDKTVLDFGSGWGYFLLMARAFGYNVCGLEVSAERQKFSAQSGIPMVLSLGGLHGRLFDYIHLDQVLEHVPDPQGLLFSLTPHLKEGGIMYLSVPNGKQVIPDSILGKIDLYRKSAYPLEHINCFTHRSLIKLAEKAGLKVVGLRSVTSALMRGVSLFGGAHLLQAVLEDTYRYRTSTNLYFVKK